MFYGVSAKCLCLKVMEFSEFEYILSAKRMRRYKDGCGGETRRAMALYRYNLRLSEEMFNDSELF